MFKSAIDLLDCTVKNADKRNFEEINHTNSKHIITNSMSGISYSNSRLSIVGQDLTEIPPSLPSQYPDTTVLDLSHNLIRKVSGLDGFKSLQNLVIDENELTSEQEFPLIPSLSTLWVNNNKIDDLSTFLQSLKSFPNLTYLSMLKNPACPNFFTGKQQEEYQRYRYHVIFKIPTLKFLDATPVSAEERAESLRVGHLMQVAKPNIDHFQQSQKELQEKQQKELSMFGELPQDNRQIGETRASLGVARYVYQGLHSEGNRFISNSDL